MYRFALRPWWIVSHVVVLMIIVTFVALGFWQLRRLDEVRDRNAQLAERLAEPAVPVEELVPLGTDEVAEAAVDHQATATGTYRVDETVLIRGRSLDDQPGSWIVVPLELADGQVLAVNRGWIRNDGRYSAVPEENRAVPAGEVTVHGILHPTQERGTLGAVDPPDGTLDSLARIDLARLDQQTDGELMPVWLQLTEAEPGAPEGSPRPLAPPVVDDEGPHLSYAVQWFIFTTIAIVGYPLILRRAARDRSGRHPDDAPGLDDADPDDAPAPGVPRLDAEVP